MNFKVAQYILPKLIRGGKGSSKLACRAATTLFSAPQTAKTSTSIFSRVTNKTCNVTKQTAQKAFDRVIASDTFAATQNFTNRMITGFKNSKIYTSSSNALSKAKNKFVESKFFKGAVKKVRKGIAYGCKNKVIRDTYGEMYFASKAYKVAKAGVKYSGPAAGLVKTGAGALQFAKEVGPIPFATGAAGAVMVPCPGTAEIGLFLGLLAKKGVNKVSDKLIRVADNCFLTLVK